MSPMRLFLGIFGKIRNALSEVNLHADKRRPFDVVLANILGQVSLSFTRVAISGTSGDQSVSGSIVERMAAEEAMVVDAGLPKVLALVAASKEELH